MFVVVLLVLSFFIIWYFVKILASINSKLNILQKDLNKIQMNMSFLLELKNKVVDSLCNTHIIEHDIKNIKSKIERVEADLAGFNINKTAGDISSFELYELKEIILRVEKYLYQQNKFNDVWAKEPFDLKKDMAHVITKLKLNFSHNESESYLRFKHLLSHYPNSIPCGSLWFNENNDDIYAIIFLDFPGLFSFLNEEIDENTGQLTKLLLNGDIDATKLLQVNSHYCGTYSGCSEEDEEFYKEQNIFDSFDPGYYGWYKSKFVIKKGIEVSACVFEIRPNKTDIERGIAEIISVKQNGLVTVKMSGAEKETIRTYKMSTISPFPYITDDGFDDFGRKFSCNPTSSGFSFQKSEEDSQKIVSN
ncbi:TPA: hypothetical protein RGI49_001997 [Legionella pneumophila]|uniref:Uncharacterized protein n=1 Tax=Legionella pneumophila TaxID=446 RepID=A0AAP3HEA1_LEGPN|nr:hypothetical protein [Legionella pneumophila]HAT9431925.1 hypothetical protein [Legionella pneumophila subsp. pneumophila]MCZ4691354.1 hypothetical protein [Legionella pneumophila]MCZ4711054.1 hypothetical protein [Legionella pneumophila]MCZ4719846.1 hypothetical protein [Legionella pneumophila]MDW9185046.1 hypothetical protein [Legionella pneumophila]